MSERIRITPQQIVARNSSGDITFNTDYNYIKTGSGTLFAGGNTRAPAIYGQNTISDHGYHGGYCTGIQNQQFGSLSAAYGELRYEIPKCNFVTLQFSEKWVEIGPRFLAPSRNTEFLNYDTGQQTQLSFVYRFSMLVSMFGLIGTEYSDETGSGYYTTQLMAWPNFFDIPPAVTSASGGVYILPVPQGTIKNALRTITYNDEFGNAIVSSQTVEQFYYETPIWVRPHSLFVYRSPTALSLARTP